MRCLPKVVTAIRIRHNGRRQRRPSDDGPRCPEGLRIRINRHDFSLLAGLIADDASFWFSDGTHQGLPEIRAAFEHTWQSLGNETYWLDDLV